jgi:hypothetical protein
MDEGDWAVAGRGCMAVTATSHNNNAKQTADVEPRTKATARPSKDEYLGYERK